MPVTFSFFNCMSSFILVEKTLDFGALTLFINRFFSSILRMYVVKKLSNFSLWLFPKWFEVNSTTTRSPSFFFDQISYFTGIDLETMNIPTSITWYPSFKSFFIDFFGMYWIRSKRPIETVDYIKKSQLSIWIVLLNLIIDSSTILARIEA